MNWIDIIIVIILVLSFIGGVKEGMVKNIFSLVGLLIAIPLAGTFYRAIANLLAFLPGEDWENFIGFYIMLAIVLIIFHLIFLLPRKLLQKALGAGGPFRLVGGLLNVLSTAIGFAVFTLVLRAYPIFGWLEQWVSGSSVLIGMVRTLGFVQGLLPEVFRQAASIAALL